MGFRAASYIKDPDTRLEFLLDFLDRFYEAAEGPDSQKMIKGAVTKLLNEYANERNASDVRLLRAWHLLVSYSTNILFIF